eukprot:gene5487-3961_t
MRPSEVERIRELEGAIAAREREIEELKEHKEQLQSQLVSISASGEDLLRCYPVYDYCGRRPKKNIREVPIEQFSNTLVQFDVATKAVKHQNAQDTIAVTELKNYIREQGRAEKLWREKKQKLAEETGIDLPYTSAARRSELMEMQAYQPEADPRELDARRKILLKELAAGQLIRAAKGKTIEVAKKKLAEREEMVTAIDELYNDIRVADRDIELTNQEVDRLRGSEEHAVQCIEYKNSEESHKHLLVEQVQQLVQNLNEERQELVLDKCDPQERVMKAQDYRIRQLEKRLKATERCLRNNCSIKDVQAILESKWDAVTPESLELQGDLMDIERIIPADEKVHPGLYNLFLREKEKLAQSICKINILVAEKESVMASQACKLEALSRACNQAIQELDEVANNAAFEEEKQRRQALEWAREQRAYYCELLQEKNGK